MKQIEMHCHSTRSDGLNTPEEVIAEAQKLQLDFLTLTDHDIISPKDFKQALEKVWVQTCDGVEISGRNYDLWKSLHLVSYAKVFWDSLRDVLSEAKRGKMNMKWGQFYKMIEEFWFIGTKKWFDEYIISQWRKPWSSNKYDMARYFYQDDHNKQRMVQILWDLLTSKDVVARFYEECFKREGSLYAMYWHEVADYEPSVETAVDEVVEKSWGIVSLAHPNVTWNQYKWWIPELERTVADYVDKWVNAIEINAKASAEWIAHILDIRERFDLILTFWSDCHSIWYDGRDWKHGTIWQINPLIVESERELQEALGYGAFDTNFERILERVW